MKYLLDTNIISYFLNGNETVKQRFQLTPGADLSTSFINISELYYGLERRVSKSSAKYKISRSFFDTVQIAEIDFEVTRVFAQLKTKLEKMGKRLEDFDVMIAAVAMRHGLILVTHNLKHFQRIRGLKVEDWS